MIPLVQSAVLATAASLGGLHPGGTWSAAIKGPGIALSGGDLVATRSSGGWQCVLATAPIVGVQSFTVVVTGTNPACPGISNAGLTVGSYPGDTPGLAINDAGAVTRNGGSIGSVGFTVTSGDEIFVECDEPGDRVRFANLTSGSGLSAWFSLAGMTRPIYPMCGLFDALSTATLNPN